MEIDFLNQSDEVKARTFDKILNHLLFVACKDKRHREELRVKIALKKIEAWIKEIKIGGV